MWTQKVGTCEVSIPRDHRVGVVERPVWWRFEFRPDPNKHIVLHSISPSTTSAFLAELNGRLDRSQTRMAFVFVHGFNVSFEDAALRTAQLAYDLDFDGAPLMYSWPSSAD